jgi:hypothetical protein
MQQSNAVEPNNKLHFLMQGYGPVIVSAAADADADLLGEKNIVPCLKKLC